MEFWKEYLIRIVCAAILCTVAAMLIQGDSVNAKLTRLLCSLYLTVCVISPITQMYITDLDEYFHQFDVDVDAAVLEGEKIAQEQTSGIIKSNTESYILDKASSLGLSIDVEVTVSDSVPMIPIEASLTGTAAPLYKNQLQNWIEDELGIEKEHQKWR